MKLKNNLIVKWAQKNRKKKERKNKVILFFYNEINIQQNYVFLVFYLLENEIKRKNI